MVSLKNMLRVGYNYVRSIWSNPVSHSTLHSANTNAGFIKGYGAQNVARYDMSEKQVVRVGINRDKSISAGQGIESGRTYVADDREVRKVEGVPFKGYRYGIQIAERYGKLAIVFIDKNDVPISEDTQMEIEAGSRSFLGRAWNKIINWFRGK